MLFDFEISAQQLREKIAAGERMLILDVRTLDEYARSHIENAKLVPLASLPQRAQSLAEWREQSVVIYCQRGPRSMDAMAILKEQGFKSLKILDGGIDAWEVSEQR